MSIINTSTNTVVKKKVKVGDDPYGIAITSNGSRAYVTNRASDTVSVLIKTSTNKPVRFRTVKVRGEPAGVGIS